jgi:glucans biosynthesis protein C
MENTPAVNSFTDIGRINYLDQVRALAMMIGIFVHACYPYAYGIQEGWSITDQTSSVWVTFGFYFIHLFRMAVFYFIAGFFANYLYQKRGITGFLKNRMKRLSLPFVIFLPLLMIGVVVTQLFTAFYLPEDKMSTSMRQAAGTIKSQIAQSQGNESGFAAKTENTSVIAASNKPDTNEKANVKNQAEKSTPELYPPVDPRTEQRDSVITLHLWFLYNLIWFCLAAALFARFKSRFITGIFNKFFSSPLYIWILPLLMVPALFSVPVPSPPPSSFIPRLWSFSYYGVFFLIGWHFFYHRDYLDKFKKHLSTIIIFSVIATVLYLYLSPMAESYRNSIPSGEAGKLISAYNLYQKLALVILEAYLSVFLTIISLVLGKRYLNYSSRFMRFISDSSYWIYLIHWPLVTFIQVFFVTAAFSGYFKFILSTGIMLGIGLLTYRYMVRYTFIGTMLNGERIKGEA